MKTSALLKEVRIGLILVVLAWLAMPLAFVFMFSFMVGERNAASGQLRSGHRGFQ